MPLWLAVLVAALAGPLMDLAYPSASIPVLVFPAVAMVLLTCIGRTAWGSVLVGAVFAASFYLIHILWITRYLGPIPWFGLAGAETLLFAAASVLITLAYRWTPRVLPGRWGRIVTLPALVAGVWTLREVWMGSWPYTGFPWARIGMSQAGTPLAHVASWVGVSGLTFLMVFVVAAAIEMVRTWRAPGARRALSFAPAAIVAAALIFLPAFPTSSAGTMRVGSVQGNGPAGYFDDRSETSVFEAQLAATEPIADEDLDVLLWPEGGIDWDITRDEGVQKTLTKLSNRLGAPLIVNSATLRDDVGYNTSVLWQGDRLVALHDKRNPVPMGEYVPDRWLFEKIVPDLVGLIQREYTPGTNAPFFDVNGVGVGLAICFDVIYDGVIWEGARDGAQVYMFQTNNADFRDTDENLQQLEFARMRAIETGRAVVNISTVGTSQVIDKDGTVMDALPEAEAGAMVTDVPLYTGLTPAVVVGGWIQGGIVAMSALALVAVGVLARMRRGAASRQGNGAS